MFKPKTDLTRDELIEVLINKRTTEDWPSIHLYLKGLGYAPSTIGLYIKDAQDEIKARAHFKYGEHLEEEIKRMTHLYDLNIAKDDIKEARLCLAEINKLKGLNIERKEIKTDVVLTAKFGTAKKDTPDKPDTYFDLDNL